MFEPIDDIRECPECGGYGTGWVHSEMLDGERFQQVRSCSCGAEYVVEFGNPHLIEVAPPTSDFEDEENEENHE